jgi:hypothetical protein
MSTNHVHALVIPTDPRSAHGEVREISQDLDSLQSLVGGYLEAVYGLDANGNLDVTIYLNEEGKIRQMPINAIATQLWWYHIDPGMRGRDVLCGPAVILGAPDAAGEDLLPVPQHVIDAYHEIVAHLDHRG